VLQIGSLTDCIPSTQAKDRGVELIRKLQERVARSSQDLNQTQKELIASRKTSKEEKEAKELAQTSKDISESILTMKKDKILRLEAELEDNMELVESAKWKVAEAEAAAERSAEQAAEATKARDRKHQEVAHKSSNIIHHLTSHSGFNIGIGTKRRSEIR